MGLSRVPYCHLSYGLIRVYCNHSIDPMKDHSESVAMRVGSSRSTSARALAPVQGPARDQCGTVINRAVPGSGRAVAGRRRRSDPNAPTHPFEPGPLAVAAAAQRGLDLASVPPRIGPGPSSTRRGPRWGRSSAVDGTGDGPTSVPVLSRSRGARRQGLICTPLRHGRALARTRMSFWSRSRPSLRVLDSPRAVSRLGCGMPRPARDGAQPLIRSR